MVLCGRACRHLQSELSAHSAVTRLSVLTHLLKSLEEIALAAATNFVNEVVSTFPQRATNRREMWWRHGETVPGLRAAIASLRRFRYAPRSTFETFPFPSPTDERREAIATAARILDTFRQGRLNPDGPSPQTLRNRTLTNFYNDRPTCLVQADDRLDRAVLAAYGWDSILTDTEIIERLPSCHSRPCRGGQLQPGRLGKGRYGSRGEVHERQRRAGCASRHPQAVESGDDYPS